MRTCTPGTPADGDAEPGRAALARRTRSLLAPGSTPDSSLGRAGGTSREDRPGSADTMERSPGALEGSPGYEQERSAALVAAGEAYAGDAAAAGGVRVDEVVRAFCEEVRGNNGAFYRRFVAASYGALWAAYSDLRPMCRHFYEVIREARPCHLYFDLEYVPAVNPGVQGDTLVDALLRLVAAELQSEWGLRLEPDWVWELDSSGPAKWSRHVVVRVPGAALRDTAAAGALVARLLARPEAAALRVRKEVKGAAPGEQHFTSVVDTAVYTRNRHFRVLWSSKGGKSAVLKATGRFATAVGAGKPPQELFLATLVCNTPPGARLLAPAEAPCQMPGAGAGGVLLSGGSRSGEVVALLQRAAAAVKVAWKHSASDAEEEPVASMAEVRRWAEGAVEFIERVAAQRAGGLPAAARTVALCGVAGTVAYSMLGPGSHWCENVGRAHKSNHVFFVVALAEGRYAQKCHDPECAHFRSGWMPLPEHLRLRCA
ncbi:hypothetical protein WJX81_007732 [Elliptochloris bilobata]|uniref:DNA-directed primase/polymerase protein n=1 Tax=Elliptochloris bilobata TaxID=381761 RepID=A0AAW1QWM7_9CHLO